MKLKFFLFLSLIASTGFLIAFDAYEDSTVMEESFIQTSEASIEIEDSSVQIPKETIETEKPSMQISNARVDDEWYKNFWTYKNVYIAGLILGTYVFRVRIGKMLMGLRQELTYIMM